MDPIIVWQTAEGEEIWISPKVLPRSTFDFGGLGEALKAAYLPVMERWFRDEALLLRRLENRALYEDGRRGLEVPLQIR